MADNATRFRPVRADAARHVPSLYVFNAAGRVTAVVHRGAPAAGCGALGVTMAVLASFGTIVIFSRSAPPVSFIIVVKRRGLRDRGKCWGWASCFRRCTRVSLTFAGNAGSRGSGDARSHRRAARSNAPEAATERSKRLPPRALPPGALDRLEGQVLGRHVKTCFRIWVLVFGLVGAMGWVLRMPFIHGA